MIAIKLDNQIGNNPRLTIRMRHRGGLTGGKSTKEAAGNTGGGTVQDIPRYSQGLQYNGLVEAHGYIGEVQSRTKNLMADTAVLVPFSYVAL